MFLFDFIYIAFVTIKIPVVSRRFTGPVPWASITSKNKNNSPSTERNFFPALGNCVTSLQFFFFFLVILIGVPQYNLWTSQNAYIILNSLGLYVKTTCHMGKNTHQWLLCDYNTFFSLSLKVRLREIRDKVRFTWVAPSSTVFFNLWTSSIKGISVSIATGLLRSEESTYTENYVENKGKNKQKRMEKRLSVACKGDLSPDDKMLTQREQLN